MGICEQATEDTGDNAYPDAERAARRSGSRRADERTLGNRQEEADREVQHVFKGEDPPFSNPKPGISHLRKETEGGREGVIDGTGKSKFVEFPEGRHSTFMRNQPHPTAG